MFRVSEVVLFVVLVPRWLVFKGPVVSLLTTGGSLGRASVGWV